MKRTVSPMFAVTSAGWNTVVGSSVVLPPTVITTVFADAAARTESCFIVTRQHIVANASCGAATSHGRLTRVATREKERMLTRKDSAEGSRKEQRRVVGGKRVATGGQQGSGKKTRDGRRRTHGSREASVRPRPGPS